jgi:hypothetical protein
MPLNLVVVITRYPYSTCVCCCGFRTLIGTLVPLPIVEILKCLGEVTSLYTHGWYVSMILVPIVANMCGSWFQSLLIFWCNCRLLSTFRMLEPAVVPYTTRHVAFVASYSFLIFPMGTSCSAHPTPVI